MTKALLLIDVQKAFLDPAWGPRNHPKAEENMKRLLNKFRTENRPVLHAQHISNHPASHFHHSRGQAFQEGFEPLSSEPVFQKTVNAAFIGTNLETYLKQEKIEQLVIVGLTLPHCVSTTTRMAANLGFQVELVNDATASFALPDMTGQLMPAQDIHHYNLIALKDEFARIIQTADLL